MSYIRAYRKVPTPTGERNEERTVSIEQAWALIAMADRINDGRYVKVVEYAPIAANREFVDGEYEPEKDVILYRPNRELIRDSVDIGVPEVTEEDRVRGQAMAEHFQGLIFDTLGAKEFNEFDQKILSLIQKSEIKIRTEMAYMACLGSRYRKEVTRERVADRIGRLGATSRFQGQVGDNLRRAVRVLSRFAGRTFVGSVVRATDGENLYFWTSSKTVDQWPDENEFVIVGTVKSHSKDQNGYQETRLTRVKVAT